MNSEFNFQSFISYSSEDKDDAFKIFQQLEQKELYLLGKIIVQGYYTASD